jgi:hypothetical protein
MQIDHFYFTWKIIQKVSFKVSKCAGTVRVQNGSSNEHDGF